MAIKAIFGIICTILFVPAVTIIGLIFGFLWFVDQIIWVIRGKSQTTLVAELYKIIVKGIDHDPMDSIADFYMGGDS